MKPIIGIHLAGGLANMLFQIAAGECLARKHDFDVCYPNVRDHFAFLRAFGQWVSHCDEYLTAFPNIDWFKNEDRWGEITKVQQVGFRYEEIVPKHGTKYVGYFQSEKNFFGMTDFVQWLFDGGDYKYITGKINVAVHVRRGNYLWHPDHHVVLDIDYYNMAMDYMRGISERVLFIFFSDDIDWCRENFKGRNIAFSRSKDYVALTQMSRCDHNIIANSSFSWLGAYLNPNPDKIVIAPKRWFPHNKPDPSDIIPSNWITI